MIKRLLRPLEIYILSIAFFFSISFDRNLNLDDVEDSPVKKILENIIDSEAIKTLFVINK